MRYFLIVIVFAFSFSDESRWWGCMDESAFNYDPYAFLDCGSWCCEHEDINNYGIIINEINYNPSSDYEQSDEDYEFIEFYNNGDEVVDLTGWYLANSSTENCYTFEDINLNPGQYLILARNSQTYPNSIDYGLHNSLSNSEGTLTLTDAHYNIIDQVSYKDDCECNDSLNCWPTNADAGGSSLELINPDSYNHFASSWQDSYTIPGGTPGYANSNQDGGLEGCTDMNACNYNSEATIDNGLCDYPQDNYDCDDNCTADIDCNGDCGGNSIIDACGTCGGFVFEESDCVNQNFSVSFGDFNIEDQWVDINLNNEGDIAGFQFSVSGLEISNVIPLSIEELNFSISHSETTIIGFTLTGEVISPSDTSILRIFYANQFSSEVCIDSPIFSDPYGEEVDLNVGDCLSISGCADVDACNYIEYDFQCIDCCSYAQEYWLDTDGDGLGYLENGAFFCEPPSEVWVPNHGDEYPNCFSNFVDGCGDCDGDNSACSGCIDEEAFNYNCLNGNWPSSATYGCNDNVIVQDESCIFPPNGFEFLQSTKQSFYEFENASFNGEELEFMGSWIGAFKDGECVGSWPWVGEFTTVPVMGYDESDYTENYMLNGEFPEFYIYDPVLDDSFLANLSDTFPFSDLAFYHIESIDAFSDDWIDYGFILGDINIDYQVDIIDVTNQVNFILDFNSPNEYEQWAADMNSDLNLNVADVVYLSNHILGLLRGDSSAKAYITNNTLNIEGAIGGIQFSGSLMSNINDYDIIRSNRNKNIIYSLDGGLETKEFIFDEMPDDLLVVGVNGDIIEVDSKVSSHFGLEDAYPNPFNPTTTMSFNIPYNSRVVIEVYNINGSNVATLSDQEYVSGYHSVTWNADSFSSGIYFVRMVAGSYMSTQRITLMK